MQKVIGVVILMMWSQFVTASWSPDIPLSTAVTYVDNYSVYVSNLLHAANERARTTAYATTKEVEWYCVGSSLAKRTNTVAVYHVDPVEYIEERPWVAGVTNVPATIITATNATGLSGIQVIRFKHVYTNGTWLTNAITARITLPWDPATTITSVVHRESVYANGTMVTNLAYNSTIKKYATYYEWIVTGKAYDILKPGMYDRNGSHWPSMSGTPMPDSILPSSLSGGKVSGQARTVAGTPAFEV